MRAGSSACRLAREQGLTWGHDIAFTYGPGAFVSAVSPLDRGFLSCRRSWPSWWRSASDRLRGVAAGRDPWRWAALADHGARHDRGGGARLRHDLRARRDAALGLLAHRAGASRCLARRRSGPLPGSACWSSSTSASLPLRWSSLRPSSPAGPSGRCCSWGPVGWPGPSVAGCWLVSPWRPHPPGCVTASRSPGGTAVRWGTHPTTCRRCPRNGRSSG